MPMSPEELAAHKVMLARIGLRHTEVFGPTDMTEESVQQRMRTVAETANRAPSIFNELNDFDLGNQVRMLTRQDSAHEGVVCAARDRIFSLSLQVATLGGVIARALTAIDTEVSKTTTDMQDMRHIGVADDQDGEAVTIGNCLEDTIKVLGRIRAIVSVEPAPAANDDDLLYDGWTSGDSKAAIAEGWAIFDMNGSLTIQKDDESSTFPDDGAAVAHVEALAAAGSPLHVKALACIQADIGREPA